MFSTLIAFLFIVGMGPIVGLLAEFLINRTKKLGMVIITILVVVLSFLLFKILNRIIGWKIILIMLGCFIVTVSHITGIMHILLRLSQFFQEKYLLYSTSILRKILFWIMLYIVVLVVFALSIFLPVTPLLGFVDICKWGYRALGKEGY